jgi:biopolymer transport protein ExbB/TolQ
MFCGPCEYAIIFLAVAGVALVVAIALTVRRASLIPPLLVSQLEKALNSGDVGAARELCTRATALRNVLFAGLARVDDDPQAAARAAHLAAEKERLALKRFTGWLLLIAISAALIGALGTVSRFTEYYDVLAIAKSIRPADTWRLYSKAVVAGYMGLLVAIVLFPAWWFFSARAGMLAHEIEMTAEDLISRVGSEHVADAQAMTESQERK